MVRAGKAESARDVFNWKFLAIGESELGGRREHSFRLSALSGHRAKVTAAALTLSKARDGTRHGIGEMNSLPAATGLQGFGNF